MTEDYIVCPKCGSPMYRVNGIWACRVCGNVLRDKNYALNKNTNISGTSRTY